VGLLVQPFLKIESTLAVLLKYVNLNFFNLHDYKILTLRASLCANISRTLRLSISENLSRSIPRIPKSDSLSWDTAARKYVFSSLSFEKLRLLLDTITGRVKNIVYALTTSGKQTETFPDSWWHSMCLEDPWLSGERAGTGSKRLQLSMQIGWNVVAVLLCQFCNLVLQVTIRQCH